MKKIQQVFYAFKSAPDLSKKIHAGKTWFLPQAIRAGDRKLRNVALHKDVVVHAKFRTP